MVGSVRLLIECGHDRDTGIMAQTPQAKIRGYFGGYVKPANLKEHRIDRRFARNQNVQA